MHSLNEIKWGKGGNENSAYQQHVWPTAALQQGNAR